MNKLIAFLLTILLFAVTGCAQAQDDSGAALDELLRQIAVQYPRTLDFIDGVPFVRKAGYIAIPAVETLVAAGFEARVVRLASVEPWAGCDTSVFALEVHHPRYAGWVLVDFTTHRLYPQTAEEFIVSRAVYVALSEDANSDQTYPFICDTYGAINVDEWYDRLSDISIMVELDAPLADLPTDWAADAGIHYYADANHPLAVRLEGVALLDDWHERFYGR